MRTSLVTRLAALVAAIIVAAAAVLAAIIDRATSSEFVTVMREELSLSDDSQRYENLAGQLERAFSTAGLPGVVDIANRSVGDLAVRETPFVVVGRDLQVAATTEPPLANASVTRTGDGGLRIVVEQHIDGENYEIELTAQSPRRLAAASGAVFGELVLLPEPVSEQTGRDFAARIWSDVAPWLVLVLVLAVASTVWVLRRALRPIDSLTRAAGALSDGSFPGPLAADGGSAEFDALIGAFNSATRTLAETDDIRRRLISDIAHELRTPVTNMRAQLEALVEGLIAPDEAFRTILQQETRLLERLIEDFQQIAISDAGQLRLSLQALPLRETIDNILAPMVRHSNATLCNTVPGAYVVAADETRLRQILCNLFDNALREKPEGLQVHTSATSSDGRVELRFEDNGPGISEIDRPYIFDRFYRAEKSRNRETGGAGLGLTIVKGLVEAMGGRIRYEPGLAGGAAFLMTFPAAR